jgi:hypothetical protein
VEAAGPLRPPADDRAADGGAVARRDDLAGLQDIGCRLDRAEAENKRSEDEQAVARGAAQQRGGIGDDEKEKGEADQAEETRLPAGLGPDDEAGQNGKGCEPQEP